MKIITTLRKIMDNQFRPVFRRIMEKWPEAQDINALVKIASAIESESKDYFESVRQLTERFGFQLDGRKSVNGEEITDFLLQKFGKFRPDGQLSIAGCAEECVSGFMEEKRKADSAIRNFNTAHEKMLSEDIEIEIPRLIKVTDKLIRKEVINAHDCYTLLPFLDLSGIKSVDDEKDIEKE